MQALRISRSITIHVFLDMTEEMDELAEESLYAKSSCNYICHASDSNVAERSWHFLHSDQGIILVGNFYCPADATPEAIDNLRVELKNYESKVIGV